MRLIALLLASLITLASCGPTTVQTTSGGRGIVYRVPANEVKVQFRMLDSVNALRRNAGLSTLQLNPSLNAAAATHSRDMSIQNRPWHFGSDGSSPIQRVQRAGYTKQMLGENISETFETEVVTLAAWMEQEDTRNVIMDERAEDLGFAWHQEPGGKIWWTMIVGGGGPAQILTPAPIAVTAPPSVQG